MGISCDSCRERVKDFFNKELTPEAYELCLVHMVGCDSCHQFYARYAKEKGFHGKTGKTKNYMEKKK